jgi:hypothetical protein
MLGLRRDWRPDASGSAAARGSASVVAVVESSGVGERESVGKGGDVIAFVGMGGWVWGMKRALAWRYL